jgi:hypothetical protein
LTIVGSASVWNRSRECRGSAGSILNRDISISDKMPSIAIIVPGSNFKYDGAMKTHTMVIRHKEEK